MNRVKIEIQYFLGCPNSDKMIENVKNALNLLDIECDYKEVLVDTNKKAAEVKFRGSPTLVINGIDFEGLPEPDMPNLACRFYQKGIPSIEEIINHISRI